jgi:hypothetical protein
VRGDVILVCSLFGAIRETSAKDWVGGIFGCVMLQISVHDSGISFCGDKRN